MEQIQGFLSGWFKPKAQQSVSALKSVAGAVGKEKTIGKDGSSKKTYISSKIGLSQP